MHCHSFCFGHLTTGVQCRCISVCRSISSRYGWFKPCFPHVSPFLGCRNPSKIADKWFSARLTGIHVARWRRSVQFLSKKASHLLILFMWWMECSWNVANMRHRCLVMFSSSYLHPQLLDHCQGVTLVGKHQMGRVKSSPYRMPLMVGSVREKNAGEKQQSITLSIVLSKKAQTTDCDAIGSWWLSCFKHGQPQNHNLSRFPMRFTLIWCFVVGSTAQIRSGP